MIAGCILVDKGCNIMHRFGHSVGELRSILSVGAGSEHGQHVRISLRILRWHARCSVSVPNILGNSLLEFSLRQGDLITVKRELLS